MPGPLDYRFAWNNYDHPALVAAFDMSTLTPGGLLKNLAKTGAPYDGTINGALVLAPPLIRAKRTKCMDFDGATNYITVPNLVGMNFITMIVWINPDAVNAGFITERVGYNRAGLYLNSSNPPHITFNHGGGAGTVVENPKSTVALRTYMVAGVWNNSIFKELYVDGGLVNRGVAGATVDPTTDLKIGSRGDNTEKFNGRIDNLMIFNIAFTQEQMQAMNKSSLPRM